MCLISSHSDSSEPQMVLLPLQERQILYRYYTVNNVLIDSCRQGGGVGNLQYNQSGNLEKVPTTFANKKKKNSRSIAFFFQFALFHRHISCPACCGRRGETREKGFGGRGGSGDERQLMSSFILWRFNRIHLRCRVKAPRSG